MIRSVLQREIERVAAGYTLAAHARATAAGRLSTQPPTWALPRLTRRKSCRRNGIECRECINGRAFCSELGADC
eukprot:COSAG03_NODE_1344_length_4287_cov_2823.215377_2_plen_74_part_00